MGDVKLLDGASWAGNIFVDGEWRPGSAGDAAIVEPATGQELGRTGRASAADVTAAAASAAEAQQEWAALPHPARAAILRRAGDLFTQHAEELSGWNVREVGAVPGMAGFALHVAAEECYASSGLPGASLGEILPSEQPRLSMAKRVPAGVVAVISPFNVPLILSIRSVAPALALGNSVLLKPDPRTVVTGGVNIVRVFEEAGLPAGVLQLLPGGAEVGQAMVADPFVRVISFTGSTEAGRLVGEAAGRHLKRAHLELGGNSAMLVLDDADVEQAVNLAAWGSFFHQGQICMTTGRHLVADRLYDDFVEALAAKADHLPVGDPRHRAGRPRAGHRRGTARQDPLAGHLEHRQRRPGSSRRVVRRALLPPDRALGGDCLPRGLHRGDLRPGRAGHPHHRRGRGGRDGPAQRLRALARAS